MTNGMMPSQPPIDRSRRTNPVLKDDTSSGNYIAVARGSDLVVIRVVGTGNMLNAPALSDFVDEQRKGGFSRFVFDMERCRGLDSTFMGVMVGMHSALSHDDLNPELAALESHHLEAVSPEEAAAALNGAERRVRPKVEGQISAVNVPQTVRDLMSMVGVDRFVKIRGNCDLNQLETTILPERNINIDERRQLILKAHENLIEIDKRNLEQFGPFLRSLSNELSKE